MKHLFLAILACVAAPAAATPSGPLPVVSERDPGLPNHTVFRPARIARGAALPVVVFAGGGCRNAGSRFRELLGEVASHGYLVVALGDYGEPEWDASETREPRYNGRPTKTDVSQIPWAIDWAVAENARKTSRYFGRLDPARLAVMGQSCGGMQAIDFASRDHRPKTLVVLNSGTFPDDRQMGGTEVKRADLPKIAAPTLILLGGKDDIAHENGMGDFDRIASVPAFLGDGDYGHRATYFQPNGGHYGAVVVNWLGWLLKGDRTKAAQFAGPDCGLCHDPRWRVKQRRVEEIGQTSR
jgi:dienelactone hydrolase